MHDVGFNTISVWPYFGASLALAHSMSAHLIGVCVIQQIPSVFDQPKTSANKFFNLTFYIQI